MTPIALDILIGCVILLSTVAAYLRGIIKEIFTLLGLSTAFIASYEGGHVLVPEFDRWLHVPEGSDKGKADLILGILSPSMTAKLLAYGGTFVFTLVLMTMLGTLLKRWVKEAGLGVVDRGMGGIFGCVRGFLLVFLIYVPCTYLIEQSKFPDWAKESYSVPVLQKTLTWVSETFHLDKKIEDRGGGIAIKFEKIDLDKLGEQVKPAEEELKKEIKKEEKDIQKGVPDVQPDQLLNSLTPPAPVAVPPSPEPAAPAPSASPMP